jgi:hypothetical protein
VCGVGFTRTGFIPESKWYFVNAHNCLVLITIWKLVLVVSKTFLKVPVIWRDGLIIPTTILLWRTNSPTAHVEITSQSG